MPTISFSYSATQITLSNKTNNDLPSTLTVINVPNNLIQDTANFKNGNFKIIDEAGNEIPAILLDLFGTTYHILLKSNPLKANETAKYVIVENSIPSKGLNDLFLDLLTVTKTDGTGSIDVVNPSDTYYHSFQVDLYRLKTTDDNYVAYTTTLQKDGTLFINALASSEESCDFLEIYVNGNKKNSISGTQRSYNFIPVSSGDTLLIKYSKDCCDYDYDDAGYIAYPIGIAEYGTEDQTVVQVDVSSIDISIPLSVENKIISNGTSVNINKPVMDVSTEVNGLKAVIPSTLDVSITGSALLPVNLPEAIFDTYISIDFTNTPYIYTLDTEKPEVQVFDYEGNYQFSFGSYGSDDGQFKNPYGIATDGEKVYITDTGNNRVEIFDAYGNYLDQFSYNWNSISGIAVDDYFIYVADTQADTVYVYDKNTYSYIISYISGFSGEYFPQPTDLYIDEYYLYIYSKSNHSLSRIRKPEPSSFNLIHTSLPPIISNSEGRFIHNTVDTLLPFDIRIEVINHTTYYNSLEITLPSIEFSSRNGAKANIILPIYLNTDILLSNNHTNSFGILPTILSYSSVESTYTTNAKLEINAISLKSVFSQGFINSIETQVPIIQHYSRLSTSSIKVKSISQPLTFTLQAQVKTRSIIRANNILPTVYITSFAGIYSAVYNEALVINTHNLAISKFVNMNATSMAEMNGIFYISTPDGMYIFSDTPEGAEIDFGEIDLYSLPNQQEMYIRPSEMYITGKQINTNLTYLSKDQQTTLNIPIKWYNTYETRVKLPKGVRSRIIGLKMKFEKGQDFKIEKIRLIGYPVNRRVR